jgi:hypothetical protein
LILLDGRVNAMRCYLDAKSLKDDNNFGELSKDESDQPDARLVIIYLDYVFDDLMQLDNECARLLKEIVDRLNARLAAPA